MSCPDGYKTLIVAQPLRLLLLSTPVGPLGSGLGGGVELTVTNLACYLAARGHSVAIAAPAGSTLTTPASELEIPLIQISGTWQTTAQTRERSAPVKVESALANTWEYARQHQAEYDLLANFAYDWLPFYLTPFLSVPVAHFVSMGSLSDRLDDAIARIAEQHPGTLGAYTRSQAETFRSTAARYWQILGSALDLSRYDYCEQPGPTLAWVGRISPEKGLADAIAAALAARRPLKIFGKLENAAYWQRLQSELAKAPLDAPIQYCGFLPTAALQRSLGGCQALLATPKWVEAFGIAVIEALACGVPTVAYRRGGPAEIVRQGKTGWLVEPGNVEALVAAIDRIDLLDRRACRQQAENQYSLAVWGERFEQWFYQIVSGNMSS